MARRKIYGVLKGPYQQESVKERIKALFMDNIGKILTREQIIEASKDPKSGEQPENWHQRLSELRTDDGYSILSWRNRGDLKVQEYLMPHKKKRVGAGKRIKPADAAWVAVLKRADYRCEWKDDKKYCGLREGEKDPIGGGTVKLTPDHHDPHSINPRPDPSDPLQWRALCGRHQVVKKNYWNSQTGKLNVYAIVQASPEKDKRVVFDFLLDFYGYALNKNGSITRKRG